MTTLEIVLVSLAVLDILVFSPRIIGAIVSGGRIQASGGQVLLTALGLTGLIVWGLSRALG
jgi:hypothetical protein